MDFCFVLRSLLVIELLIKIKKIKKIKNAYNARKIYSAVFLLFAHKQNILIMTSFYSVRFLKKIVQIFSTIEIFDWVNLKGGRMKRHMEQSGKSLY